MTRNNTRTVRIGDRVIGGGNPVLIQSMTNTRTSDTDSTVSQIIELEKAGCDLIRCSVSSFDECRALGVIKSRINIPIIADIQFNYEYALSAIENGADKIRINPGNIGTRENVAQIANLANERSVPIRVGVNSGSLDRDIVERYGKVTPEGLAESAMRQVGILEDLDFNDIVISIKSTDVIQCIKAYEIISTMTDHPLHVGITEAGTDFNGSVRSAVGIGNILYQGIGDTIRVSLTGDPVNEVLAAKEILRSLDLYDKGITVVSCPTCGRTMIDLIGLANEVENRVRNIDLNLKVAVMGCAVNGPGEAKEADIGIAGGVGEGLLIKKGEIIRKVPEDELVDALLYELENWEMAD